ncbi:hypothetical protein NQ317_000184 [Molorchus minor]|uniref:Peptidase S54 rhomboid domain-containing protein n=1 Tax=Molorchus minor TaxID=1323400 RepID=A0ABQ9J7A7_9CUCU|nr:hypothetical protein NQ317_000184 [Molorchus minor]
MTVLFRTGSKLSIKVVSFELTVDEIQIIHKKNDMRASGNAPELFASIFRPHTTRKCILSSHAAEKPCDDEMRSSASANTQWKANGTGENRESVRPPVERVEVTAAALPSHNHTTVGMSLTFIISTMQNEPQNELFLHDLDFIEYVGSSDRQSGKGRRALARLTGVIMGTQGDGYPPSPATTPGSVLGEDKFLVPFYATPKKKWYDIGNVPCAIVIVSVLQIVFHVFSTTGLTKALRFEPGKCNEIWRFVTYMLVHDDWYHLVLNVVIQCIFALPLERRQGHLRVLVLYLLGGVNGVLGASCVHPDLVIGASAGVYALLISNIADIVLNYGTVKYKIYAAVSIGILVLFDIIYDVVHVYSKKEPLISWEAHFVGGVAGLLLGLVLYKSNDEKSSKRSKINRSLFWTGLILYFAMVISFMILMVQIKRCTPVDNIHVRYVYFC